MKKLRNALLALLMTVAGIISFTSCEGDKIYYEDPSFSWHTMFFTIDENGYGENYKWEWNPDYRRYECVINITGDNINVDEFIYNHGNAVGYVFMGQQNVNEIQSVLPYFDENKGANLWNDISILGIGSNKTFEVCFYYQWSDLRQSPPPLYNVKLALFWGKDY